MLKIVKIVLIFVVLLWVVNLLFAPDSKKMPVTAGARGVLFSRDLRQKVNQGQLVIVDKDESDKYIQEDLSTHDLVRALTFARYKSEVLEQPLYIENASTLGDRDKVVAKVDPTDRQAWQHLVLLEIDLKKNYERKNPNDLQGYMSEKSLDAKRVPQVMQEFIGGYPNSYVVTTALAHIEYSLCVAQKKADQAVAVYDKLALKYPDSEVLAEYLPKYKERAMELKKNGGKLDAL